MLTERALVAVERLRGSAHYEGAHLVRVRIRVRVGVRVGASARFGFTVGVGAT